MSKITIPDFLMTLLGSGLASAAVLDFVDRVGVILADNKTCFFPNYTNHGVEHINGVLKSIEGLIPDEIQNDKVKFPLQKADAMVIIGSTLLHDLAMHLTPAGFLELVSSDSRFRPLPWFEKKQIDHDQDLPWHDLWADFEREARKYSDRDLARIIGEQPARQWKFDGLNPDPGQWEQNDMLVVGEFIRRHHARLAHEIAIYGFPGVPAGTSDDQFPVLGAKGSTLKEWADLMGVVARSHGTSLRVAHAYLKYSHPGNLQPMGCAALYPMALLRVADYLQIEHQRAPAVLLHLRRPQSMISIDEWAKHKAVRSVTSADDPRGLFVTVSDDLAHTHFIQLRELLEGIQREMDHSVAVLDEVYGRCSKEGLDLLTLDKRRAHSNLFDQEFQKRLPYVPQETGFSADPNILSLLVKPLYGDDPSIGVRELMQNAVDAVRELHAWCDSHGKDITKLDLPDQEADVLLDFIEKEDGSWMLRVTDKGIGMTAETVQKYFLRAGASFRHSKEWVKEFTDDEGKLKVTRSGRFGIGAFAAFLLGDHVTVSTRHANSIPEEGLTLTYAIDSSTISLERHIIPNIGTVVVVDLGKDTRICSLLSGSSTRRLTSSLLTRWYCWTFPAVVIRVTHRDAKCYSVQHPLLLDHYSSKLPLEWNRMPWNESDSILWSANQQKGFLHNGFKVRGFKRKAITRSASWDECMPMSIPALSVLDSQDSIKLTLKRDMIEDMCPSFLPSLAKDCCFSYIASLLILGSSYSRSTKRYLQSPLHFLEITSLRQMLRSRALQLCHTKAAFAALDPWLLGCLGVNRLSLFGCLIVSESPQTRRGILDQSIRSLMQDVIDHGPALTAYTVMSFSSSNRGKKRKTRNSMELMITILEDFLVQTVRTPISFRSGAAIVMNGVTSVAGDGNNQLNIPVNWTKHSFQGLECPYFAFEKGTTGGNVTLLKLLQILKEEGYPGPLFATDLEVEIEDEPQTVLAKAWNECLGRRAIPLDPKDRKALIEHGRKHERLCYHLDRGEERLRLMKEKEMEQ